MVGLIFCIVWVVKECDLMVLWIGVVLLIVMGKILLGGIGVMVSVGLWNVVFVECEYLCVMLWIENV